MQAHTHAHKGIEQMGFPQSVTSEPLNFIRWNLFYIAQYSTTQSIRKKTDVIMNWSPCDSSQKSVTLWRPRSWTRVHRALSEAKKLFDLSQKQSSPTISSWNSLAKKSNETPSNFSLLLKSSNLCFSDKKHEKSCQTETVAIMMRTTQCLALHWATYYQKAHWVYSYYE